jgi:D-3-phosphoglycerate dehydrogenase
MKPTAFLVNASRGDLVDEAALAKALEARAIAGAALDVGCAPGQMPPDQLARRSDVIATPHIGGVTPAALRHQAMETVRQVEMLLSAQIPPGSINPQYATRLERLGRC